MVAGRRYTEEMKMQDLEWLRSDSNNQIDLDLDRFVRRDRSSPMKKNAFHSYVYVLGDVFTNYNAPNT